MGSGAAMEYVSQKKTNEMLLPLPPYAEQERIVEKIDALLELCEWVTKNNGFKNVYILDRYP